MSKVKAPKSLRFEVAINSVGQVIENNSGKTVSAVAGLIAVASFSGAEAQQPNLPPVTVDAPVARPRPAASKPSPDQTRARSALRRAARRTQPAQVAPVPFPNAGGLNADRDPYANPAAPYMATRVQASGKFPEPILNTPKSITVLTKDVLADQNSTTLKSAVLNTAGVTLGTGEGGNAFGDRFFIRGFDARNDIFLDGMRDAGVSVRENFFTEQVEILRGPGSSFAGRGTTGGAINIVTKQATTEKSFYNMDTTFGTDHTKRVVLDVNQVISPTLAIRAGGLFQDAGVAGRDYVKDDRDGGFVAAKWTPLDTVKLYANYIHTNLHGLPDFGVPYYRPDSPNPGPGNFYPTKAGGPYPDFGVSRNNFYGFVNRDYYSIKQDIGTVGGEVSITPDLTLSNKTRLQRSVLDYIGTLPEAPGRPTRKTLSLNPQSRYQVTENIANQTEAIYKSYIGGWKNTTTGGVEYSREIASIDKFAGLSSEALPGGNPGGNIVGASIFYPQFTFANTGGNPQLTGLPTKIAVDTTSAYVIDTSNYNDFVILNGGIRYDDYNIKASGFGTPEQSAQCFQCAGAAVRPAELQPRPDAEAAAEWQRLCGLCDVVESGWRRIRWYRRAIWWSGARAERKSQPDLRAREEQGDRDRHQMGVVRPALAGDRGAIPDREGKRARVAKRQQRDGRGRDSGCRITCRRGRATCPASPRARPIASGASISASAARSPTNGACSAASC